jgi:predicted amidohydrolase YtcJ
MVTHVLVNGKIVTVDDQFSMAEAVAIDGERIRYRHEEVRGPARSIDEVRGPFTA